MLQAAGSNGVTEYLAALHLHAPRSFIPAGIFNGLAKLQHVGGINQFNRTFTKASKAKPSSQRFLLAVVSAPGG